MNMNRQIGELTSIVKALTEKMSSSEEENGQNVRKVETSSRSDKMYRPNSTFKSGQNLRKHPVLFQILFSKSPTLI